MRLAVSNLIDRHVLAQIGSNADTFLDMQKRDMARALGDAAVKEGAVWSESKEYHLPGCPIRLHAVLDLVDKQTTWYFESRARRGVGPWLTRMLRRLGHQLFLWADRYERHAKR
jgi:hypothetical protein